MAQCGKCGRDLQDVGIFAFDPGHYCQPLLPGYRQVIIVMRQAGDFDVCVDGLFTDRLTWGEMLEEVIYRTNPAIRKSRFGGRTPQQLSAQDHKWGCHEEVVDAEFKEVDE